MPKVENVVRVKTETKAQKRARVAVLSALNNYEVELTNEYQEPLDGCEETLNVVRKAYAELTE